MAKAISRREAQNRRIRLRVAASLADFVGAVASVALIVLCVLLLQALVLWIRSDFSATFSLIWSTIWNSVVVGVQ